MIPPPPPGEVQYHADGYPHRAEDAQPDEDVGQRPPEGDEPVPGAAGNAAGAPAGQNRDVVAPRLYILIAAVIGGTYFGKHLLKMISKERFVFWFQAVLATLAVYLIVSTVAAP